MRCSGVYYIIAIAPFALLFGYAVSLHAATPPDFSGLTKDDIAAAVRANSNSIQDLSISFSYICTKHLPDDAFYSRHSTIVQKGGMIDHQMEDVTDLNKPNDLYQQEVAYNGRLSTLYRRSNLRA